MMPKSGIRLFGGEVFLTAASGPALLLVAGVLEELHALIHLYANQQTELPSPSYWVASSFGVHQGLQFEIMAAAWGALALCCASTIFSPGEQARTDFLYRFIGVWLVVIGYSAAFVLAYLLPSSPLLTSFESYPIPTSVARGLLLLEAVLMFLLVARFLRRGVEPPLDSS